MSHIVSANYRNRRSSKRWLLREESQEPKEAIEYKSVQAENVNFEPSGEFESGFGCSIVARAMKATGGNEETNLNSRQLGIEERLAQLIFCGSWFEDGNGNVVRSARVLNLNADGSMIAILGVESNEHAMMAATAT